MLMLLAKSKRVIYIRLPEEAAREAFAFYEKASGPPEKASLNGLFRPPG